MTPVPTTRLVWAVYDEEIARKADELGQLDEYEGWYVFDGEHRERGYEEQASAVDRAVAARTGLSFERAREVRRSAPILGGMHRAKRLLYSRYGLAFHHGDSYAESGYRRAVVWCPYCEHEFRSKDMTPFEIGQAEKDHMESAHPEVIEKRLTDAGFVRKGGEWVDTLASDG